MVTGRGFALTLLALATGACLPRGEAPEGRQILADHNASVLGLVPANGDGVVRVLFFRPGADADHSDLWVLSVPPDGGPPSEIPLAKDIEEGLRLSSRPSASSMGFPLDSRGRIYLNDSRFDPVTGEVLDVGGSFPQISERGDRVLVQHGNGDSVLLEPDDTMTHVHGYLAQLLGEDLYYLSPESDLMRLAPGGAPQRLAVGIATFMEVDEQTVLITRPRADPTMPDAPVPPLDPGGFSSPQYVTGALLDTTTLVETALPVGPQYQYGGLRLSPDHRFIGVSQWAYTAAPGELPTSTFVVLDRLTGEVEMLDSMFQFGFWRPGRNELWSNAYDEVSGPSLWIKKLGEPAVVFPGINVTGLSEDGTYFFASSTAYTSTKSSDVVGLADDPGGARFPAVPKNTALAGSWDLGDGRLLTQAIPNVEENFEDFIVQVVDPRNGATRLFGEHGIMSAVGATRLLGIFNVSYERGDLTSLDLTRDQSRVLAREFAMAAVVEPQGADRYPPGGRIVYQFRARFESPWDGLWLVQGQ